MDKSTYLKQLETALRQKYPEPQVRDILSDYEDFFTSGEAEGKSEGELCEEFGPPEQAVRELKSESETDTPKNKRRTQATSCTVLAVLLVIVLLWPFFGPKLQVAPSWSIPPKGPANFWLAMLFPLALEGILALWASQSVPRKKSLSWVPRANMILAVPVAVILILLTYFTFTIPWAAKSYDSEGPFGPMHFLVFFVYYGAVASMLLVFVSIILLMLYAIRGHERVRWFLFLDTTLLTVLLNYEIVLSHINSSTTYNGSKEIGFCFLWGILPNLAAVGIYWAILKIVSNWKVRREKAWTGR